MSDPLVARARAFMEDDIDPGDRAELGALLERASKDPSGTAHADLASRFMGPLRFGTAGLRGRVEAGESRMNRATVARATAGLAEHLLAAVPKAASRGVVLGRDARDRSQAFQEETASILAAQGLKVFWLPEPVPTPVVAFGVRRLQAAAGIMITASHNPPADNGYKVFWDHGAQIAPPTDSHIAEAIDRQPGARHLARASSSSPLIEPRRELVEAYLEVMASLRIVPEAPLHTLSVAYTPLHGVAGGLFLSLLERRGVRRVAVIEEQFEPDPRFPTVAFPNPEEPGALDLAVAHADRVGADLVLAHDPDGDRLAAMVRCPRRGMVALSGNDLGILLARHLIDHDDPGDFGRLVVNTVVSSRLLERMAKDLQVRYSETLTGFKHIAERMRLLEEQEGLRPILGYEEALGYAVSRAVHDKDGLSAGLVLVEMAAVAKGDGRTLLDVLEAIHRSHGLFVGYGRSVFVEGHDGPARIATAMERLRSAPWEVLGALGLSEVWDLAQGTRRELRPDGRTYMDPSLSGDVLVFDLAEGGRAAVRPSGTEPKLKLYLETEAVWPPSVSHEEAIRRGRARLERVERGLLEWAGLDSSS